MAEVKKQNIILITIDSLRADYCGWLNELRKDLTPNLNKLADDSFVFINAYSTGPSTPFSFPAIFSGTYPFSFHKWDKKNFPGLEQRPSLSKQLEDSGYYTVAVHDNPYLSSFYGYDIGFSDFYYLGGKKRKEIIFLAF